MGRTEESPNSKDNNQAAEAVKRKLRSVTRASASRELCHINPVKKPRRGFDGKFVRPIGRPPVEGFVWDAVNGYWIPRGARREAEAPPRRAESSTTTSSSSDESSEGENKVKTHASVVGRQNTQVSQMAQDDKTEKFNQKQRSVYERAVATETGFLNRKNNVLNQTSKSLNSSFAARTGLQSHDDSDSGTSSDTDADIREKTSRVNSSVGEEDNVKKKKSRLLDIPRKPLIETQDDYHPDSIWQERKPLDGSVLTLYERHRKPRAVPTGTFRCALKALKQEFRCVICLGYIRNARIVKECLHRFCEQCIEKALLQVGRRNECPICRVFIPTRRSLAPDPNFDKLIQCILKDIAIEDEQDAEESPTHQTNESRAVILQQAIRNKRRVVSEQRRGEQKIEEDTQQLESETMLVTPDENKEADLEVCHSDEVFVVNPPQKHPPIIQIVLRRDDREKDLTELQLPYISISGEATVKVLRQFLEAKICRSNLQVFSLTRDGKETLYKEWRSLHGIAAAAAKANHDFPVNYLPLYYRIAPQVLVRSDIMS